MNIDDTIIKGIKTQQSEVQKNQREQYATIDHQKSNKHKHGVGNCVLCEKFRCDCPRQNASVSDYSTFVERNKGKINEKHVSFQSNVRKSSLEKKVNFTYNKGATIKGRSHSFSIPYVEH